MRLLLTLVAATCIALLLVSSGSARGPVNNPQALELTGTCTDGSSYDAYSPPGRSLIDSLSTSNQVTEQLTVADPLNEVGGSFSVTTASYAALNRAGLLTVCTGTVAGTTAVTFTASVLKTPA